MRRVLLVWILALAVLTAVPAAVLAVRGVDPTAGVTPETLVIAYSPALAALIAVAVTGGRRGLREWGRRLIRFRAAPGWYVAVVLAPLVLVAVVHAIDLPLGGPAPSSWVDIGGPAAAIGSFIAGSVGEEPGWRGLAHPELRRRLSLAAAGVIVGVIWATWHNWIAFFPGGVDGPTDVVLGYLRLIATAIIYGWLYDRTRSVPVVMVAHLGHNLAVALLPIQTTAASGLLTAGYGLAAVILLALTRRSSTRVPTARIPVLR